MAPPPVSLPPRVGVNAGACDHVGAQPLRCPLAGVSRCANSQAARPLVLAPALAVESRQPRGAWAVWVTLTCRRCVPPLLGSDRSWPPRTTRLNVDREDLCG